jgi:hypothetical protein
LDPSFLIGGATIPGEPSAEFVIAQTSQDPFLGLPFQRQ